MAIEQGQQQRPGSNSRRTTFSGRQDARQYDHEVLELSRVVRVVKGGRRFRFRACVIIGNRTGTVGMGIGKSRDVQQAIQKAYDQAVKNAVKVDIEDGTILEAAMSRFKGALVMVRPAKPGTGIIAGGTVRMVADLAGITDLVAKRFGSANRISNARATLTALTKGNKK